MNRASCRIVRTAFCAQATDLPSRDALAREPGVSEFVVRRALTELAATD